MAKADLTAERLRELLHYDPDTGVFTWINSSKIRGHCVKAGSVAGTKFGHKYVRIGFSGVRYYAHRLAWLYVYGFFPNEVIDHINGDGHDNRISNLRAATRAQNQQNMKIHKDNSSGFLGVSFHKNRGKWAARICIGSKPKHLGMFSTAEAAHKAYLLAKSEVHKFNQAPRPESSLLEHASSV